MLIDHLWQVDLVRFYSNEYFAALSIRWSIFKVRPYFSLYQSLFIICINRLIVFRCASNEFSCWLLIVIWHSSKRRLWLLLFIFRCNFILLHDLINWRFFTWYFTCEFRSKWYFDEVLNIRQKAMNPHSCGTPVWNIMYLWLLSKGN